METEQRASRPVIRTAPARPATPTPAPPPPPPPPAEPEPTVLRGHVENVAGQARQSGEEVAATASRVSPEAGEIVRQTTGAAADVVDGVAKLLP